MNTNSIHKSHTKEVFSHNNTITITIYLCALSNIETNLRCIIVHVNIAQCVKTIITNSRVLQYCQMLEYFSFSKIVQILNFGINLHV